jgi:hypothetical protein
MHCSEEDCAVCGQWPAGDREGVRMLIDRIPLREPVCEECLMAFGRSLVVEETAPLRPLTYVRRNR